MKTTYTPTFGSFRWTLTDPQSKRARSLSGASPHQVYAALKGTTLLSLALLGRAGGLGDPRCRLERRRRLLTGFPRRPFTDPERPVQIAMNATASRAAVRSHAVALRGPSDVAFLSAE